MFLRNGCGPYNGWFDFGFHQERCECVHLEKRRVPIRGLELRIAHCSTELREARARGRHAKTACWRFPVERPQRVPSKQSIAHDLGGMRGNFGESAKRVLLVQSASQINLLQCGFEFAREPPTLFASLGIQHKHEFNKGTCHNYTATFVDEFQWGPCMGSSVFTSMLMIFL